MMRKTLAATLGITLAATALAQAKPDVLVRQRQAAMTLQGKYFGPLAAMAKGAAPYDAKVVSRNAGYLEVLSKMPWDGFDESTRREKSSALPSVWSDASKFKQAQGQFQEAVSALAAASKGGDEAKITAAIKEVGKNCGACHDGFREM